jgi:hypothetical protein
MAIASEGSLSLLQTFENIFREQASQLAPTSVAAATGEKPQIHKS